MYYNRQESSGKLKCRVLARRIESSTTVTGEEEEYMPQDDGKWMGVDRSFGFIA